ncbi:MULTISPECIES: hypothetical protein [unclassified Rhodococcus (in: high G+C Gram-positive bacteria)]|jgi:hypothetical protein|uniref:hypothetical protein n=1 Tax=unclassified Rhodococcus (in: high G+C Gram-positive bacteria) TaxID=192944 RepID=UPI0007BB327F|nr:MULTISPECIES: hypothetical protein [unclassified Rhodococcus (in: high G+C Gram-positive bacteria)]KZE99770.1 hypothetical protein A2J02_10375 [Rhodococcus sp. EPR-147]KZF00515.1 hypothetical protein A2J04_12970 [Rhodococcus sp. EPR-279]OZD70648.1 hypothetical protein CH272_24900 [Rhodococcus sp. 05-340-1]OZD72307.1 hypothetical protein CH271_02155 [Rhodococcus sp. 05-340-2]OZF33838.1 hypothetical protein CH295_12990 [Rhodococcus sp. 14-2483-1-2]
MSDTLKDRVRAKLLAQLADDGGTAAEQAEGDDPRLNALRDDLEALESAQEGDPVIDDIAARHWVP